MSLGILLPCMVVAGLIIRLKTTRRYDRKVVLDAIQTQPAYTPAEETRNRKALRENP